MVESKAEQHNPEAIRPESPPEILAAQLTAVEERLDTLAALFQEKIQEDQTKDELFARLNEELAGYRADFLFQNITKRVFLDLIRLFDRVDQGLRPASLEQLSRNDLIEHLQSFRAEIREALRRQDVNLIETEPGLFDENYQEALATQRLDSPAPDQQVLEVLRRGFRYGSRLLRPEGVVIGRLCSEPKPGDNYDG